MTAPYDSPCCELVRRFRHNTKLWCAHFSSDGTRIIARDGGIRPFDQDALNQGFIWDITSGDLLYRGPASPSGFSADGCFVAADVVPASSTMHLYKIGQDAPLLSVEGRIRFPHTSSVSETAASIAVTSAISGYKPSLTDGSKQFMFYDNSLFDPHLGKELLRLNFIAETGRVYDISADGNHVLVREETHNDLSVWDITQQQRVSRLTYDATRPLPGQKDLIERACFIPGKKKRILTVVASSKSGVSDPMAAMIWDAETGDPVAPIYCGGKRTASSALDSDIDYSFSFACSGNYLIARRADGYTGPNEDFARIFSTDSGEEIAQIDSGYYYVGAPEEAYFLTARIGSPVVNIYSIHDSKSIAHVAAPPWMSETPIAHIAVAPHTPEGKYILTTYKDGDVCLWRMPDWV